MDRILIKSVLCSISAWGLAMATSVSAQNAQQTGDKDDDLQEIVVTARRVEERLQDVPISISVFDQQQLTNRNVVTAGDLATYTPSLSVTDTFGADNVSFAIRGFVEADFTTPSVGVFFADVVAPRANGGTTAGNGAGVGSLFDLQSVQVLKGPQGTLFGRNTTGGSILLVPQKPTSEFEGYIEQSVGNYDMERTQAVINVPLNDSVRFRLGVDHQTREGYLHNLTDIGPRDFADVNYTALRASVVVDITPNLENYTIATWSDSDTNGDYPKVFGYTSSFNPNPILPFLANIPAEMAAIDQNFYDIANGKPDARQDVRQWSFINTTTWHATDLLTVKNIGSYSEFRQLQNSNIFGDPGSAGSLPIAPGSVNYLVSIGAAPGSNNVAQSTVTEELQLQGHTHDQRLTYQLGGYLEVSLPLGGFQSYFTPEFLNCTNVKAFQCTDVVGSAFGLAGVVGAIQISQSQYYFRDVGAYGQSTFKFTDQLSLTAGIRRTEDVTSGLGDVLAVHFPAANTPAFGCALPPSQVKGGTPAQIQANPALCDFRATQTSVAPTWMVDLDYKPIDGAMLYAKYSRGYRQGSIDVALYGLGNWNPEKVDAYEIGAKTSFDRFVHGTFDIAAFYNDFNHQQLQLNEVACTVQQLGTPQCPFLASPSAGIGNAGKSRIQGVEVDTSILPFTGLRLDFDYAYLDTRLESVTLPAAPVGYSSVNFPADIGGPLAYAPKNKYAVTATYTLPLNSNLGKISISSVFTHQDSEFNSPTAPPGFQTLGPQNNLNLNLNWNDTFGKPFDVSLFATNVTGEKYFEASSGTYASFGFDAAYLNAPTMYGARLRYHFGK
jgi:iron complex outermembrane receptor protein